MCAYSILTAIYLKLPCQKALEKQKKKVILHTNIFISNLKAFQSVTPVISVKHVSLVWKVFGNIYLVSSECFLKKKNFQILRFELLGKLLQRCQELLLLLRRGAGRGQGEVGRHRLTIWRSRRDAESQECVTVRKRITTATMNRAVSQTTPTNVMKRNAVHLNPYFTLNFWLILFNI